MCDESTLRDQQAFLEKSGFNRRDFGRLGLGMTLAALMPAPANALSVSGRDVSIETPDGKADAYYVHPSAGKHPGVLIWPDILGLRPAFKLMAQRLAESGYAVLVINPYYRSAVAPVIPEGAVFDQETRKIVVPLRQQLSTATVNTDAVAFLGWLDAQAGVDSSRGMATTGYCMGGPMVMQTAAIGADRIRAAGIFHGGGLATDSADSPHLLIPKMNASFLIAIATNDDAKEPQTKTILKDAFAANDLAAEIEVYPDTLHGWCPPDSKAYNQKQAERAWSAMLDLFKGSLA